MPHSIPEMPSSPPEIAQDAENEFNNGPGQENEQNASMESRPTNEDSQESKNTDITMGESQEHVAIPAIAIKEETKDDKTLEELLFADMDSDEEFPSSIGQNLKLESSPPPTASLVWVNLFEVLNLC